MRYGFAIIGSIQILLVSLITYAQEPDFEWGRSAGGTHFDQGNSVAVDELGNVYTTGHFSGTIDFNPQSPGYSLTAAGVDPFIVKHDKSGTILWAKQFAEIVPVGGFSSNCVATAIALGKNNDIFILGYYGGDVDFDPGPASFLLSNPNSFSFFICKLDSDGNFIWVKEMRSTALGGAGYPSAMQIDTAGNIYGTGYLYKPTDFDPGTGVFMLTPSGHSDIFYFKLSPSGSLIWAKRQGGSGMGIAYGLAVDPAGNVYSTGTFVDTVDFDPGPGVTILWTPGTYFVFVSKLTASGDLAWVRQFETDVVNTLDRSVGCGIVVDKDGNSYASGSFFAQTDFDPGPGVFHLTSQSTDGDAFIVKLDHGGNLKWARQFGGAQYDEATALALDVTGAIYSTGYFQDLIDVDPGAATKTFTSNGSGDFYISKFDTSGVMEWAKHLGGTGNDHAKSITAGRTGSIYLTGYFQNTIDLDAGPGSTLLNSNGGIDVFIAKYYSCLPIEDPKEIVGRDSVCRYSTHTYYVPNSADAISYTWQVPPSWVGSSNTDSITVIVDEPGTILVRVNGVCDTTDWEVLQVEVFDIAVSITKTDSVLHAISIPEAVSWQWYFNDVPLEDGKDSVVTATKTGTYSIVVFDAIGCSDTSEVRYVVPPPPPLPPCKVSLPSAFSPNGDGRNDQFGALSNIPLQGYRLQVFDRWGKMIFVSYNSADRWDGTYLGEQVHSGVYFYHVYYECIDGKASSLKGDVTVVR